MYPWVHGIVHHTNSGNGIKILTQTLYIYKVKVIGCHIDQFLHHYLSPEEHDKHEYGTIVPTTLLENRIFYN
jgi:hypothetical protein